MVLIADAEIIPTQRQLRDVRFIKGIYFFNLISYHILLSWLNFYWLTMRKQKYAPHEDQVAVRKEGCNNGKWEGLYYI